MFTDEKMELVYSTETEGRIKKTLQVLLDFMESNAKNPNFAIKQADNIWRLFCKRHIELNPDAFGKLLVQSANSEDLKNSLIVLLNIK